jgi:hypothetical protein
MINKKMLVLAASAALIANLAIGVTSADTTTSDQQINGGSLTIVATPATVNFPNLNVSTASQENYATFSTNSVEIQDTRSTSSPFTFSLTSTDFEDTSNIASTFDLSVLAIDVDGGLSVTDVGSSDCAAGITLLNGGASTAFSDADNDAISDTEALMVGDTRIRVMGCMFSPSLVLTVPGSQASGTYRSTFAWSIS